MLPKPKNWFYSTGKLEMSPQILPGLELRLFNTNSPHLLGTWRFFFPCWRVSTHAAYSVGSDSSEAWEGLDYIV